MSEKVEQVLQKISFIEQDIELHKNILAGIPTGQEEEMERVIKEISRLTQRVKTLKDSIAEIDPAVHAHITKLEQATREFQEQATGKNFQQVVTLDQSPECSVNLVDGSRVECLVKAQDDSGNWTVLTLEGETRVFSEKEVAKS